MKKLSLALMLVLSIAGSAFAQAADAKAKADEILKQARAAIGSESKFKNLQALSAEGTVKQNIGEGQNQRQMESTLEIELMTPDKIKLSQVQQFGTNTRAFNGTSFWTEFVPAVGMGGPGGGGFQMRGAGGPGGPGGANASMTAVMNYMQTQQRYEMIRLLQSWFLAPPASTQMQYAYVGEGPGPNGTKLDVVDSKSADGVATRLYFDQESHRLVGISYKAKNMRQAFGGRQGRGPGGPGGPGGQGQAGQAGQGGGNRPPQQAQTGAPAGAPAGQAGAPGQPGQGQQRPQMTPEEREKMAKERAEAFEKAPDVDYRWAFDDFKSVGGLNIPHRLTKIEAGTPTEEWEITKFKVNPKLTADKFEKKEKAAN